MYTESFQLDLPQIPSMLVPLQVFASRNAPTPSASHLPQLRIIDTQPRVVAFPNSDGWKSGKSRHGS